MDFNITVTATDLKIITVEAIKRRLFYLEYDEIIGRVYLDPILVLIDTNTLLDKIKKMYSDNSDKMISNRFSLHGLYNNSWLAQDGMDSLLALFNSN